MELVFFNRIRTTALGFSFVLLAGGAGLPAQAKSDLYYGFTLIDPATKRVVKNAYVEVEDGVIAAIGTGRPTTKFPAGSTHDLTGKYVLPGFVNYHAHITMRASPRSGPEDDADSIDSETQHNARIALARGTTTVRDPGGDPVANAHYNQMVSTHQWIAPDTYHAGAVIQPTDRVRKAYVYPKNDAEMDAEAARQAALGMRYFKLYTGLSEQEVGSGIRAAHRHGLKAIAHLNLVSWQRAIDLGLDGLEHALPTSPDLLEPGKREQFMPRPDSTFMYRWFELVDYDGPLMQKLIRTMAQRKIPVDLTLLVNERIYNSDRIDSLIPQIEIDDLYPALAAAYMPRMRQGPPGWTPDDYRRARAVMPKVLEFARRLHDAGVPMMLGTDGGGGIYFAHEMELHVQAGIPAWDVLQMATSAPAEAMGLGKRIGQIRKGFEADLVILDGDPVADISAAGKVFGVVNNGSLLLSAELRKAAGS